MGATHRMLYPMLNASWGASLGLCAALLAFQAGSWTGRPSGQLLAAGGLAIFGAAYLITVTARGQRPTWRGAATAALAGAGVYAAWGLAVVAPGWAIVWVAAAVAGVVTGLLRPLPR
jgi:hypothetical protein